jgi:hypothetical protein
LNRRPPLRSWIALAAGLALAPLPASAQETAPPAEARPGVNATLPDTLQAGGLRITEGAVREVDLWATGVSPTGAVLMTPVFPGWGQLYADNSWRAALAYGVQMFYWTNMLSRDRQAVRAREFARNFPAGDVNRERYDAIATENWEQMRDFAWWSGGVLLIVALDAYVGAHLFRFDRDPVPVPDRWDDQFGPVGGDLPGGRPPLTVTVFQWRKTF